MKKDFMYAIILAIVFTSALLIKSHFVDPVVNEVYADIYGIEEVGH
ncbi:hypothetical protein [Jeotgalicoccus sp. S0W5]|nr:hypothetical protein [Jeotgalicoccus sp. S0W5]